MIPSFDTTFEEDVRASHPAHLTELLMAKKVRLLEPPDGEARLESDVGIDHG